ncbi:hypothetical protein D3C76_1351730 [compost metagenome]
MLGFTKIDTVMRRVERNNTFHTNVSAKYNSYSPKCRKTMEIREIQNSSAPNDHIMHTVADYRANHDSPAVDIHCCIGRNT